MPKCRAVHSWWARCRTRRTSCSTTRSGRTRALNQLAAKPQLGLLDLRGRALTSPWAKRRYPWGEEPPAPERANLDAAGGGCLDVGALPESDSYFGCRQMIGNVWEWCADA